MAERRYGFRFSFAEGCIIVAGLMIASFLVFLFGVYAGREMEARKAAEHTRVVRVAVSQGGQENSSSREGEPSASAKETPEKFAVEAPPTVPVVVVAPQKPSPPAPSPPSLALATPALTPSPEKESAVKPELSSLKVHADLMAQNQKPSVAPQAASRPLVQDKKPQVKEVVAAPPPAKTPTKPARPASGQWSVQIHATRDEGAAQQLARQLRSQGYAPVVSKIERDGEVWYRVRVGSFASADEARASVERFRREGKFRQAYPASN
jgi:septal ring-binding cell division protein DamX